jgi:S-adenosylmethionine decarboxylase
MTPGFETIVDALGCSAGALRDLAVMRRLCQRLIDDLKLLVVGQAQWHGFPEPGGVTGLYLLSESHLACHTYPEIGLATFNLYCCRQRAVWEWRRWLARELRAEHVEIRVVARGEHVSLAKRNGEGLAENVSYQPGAPISPRRERL